MLQKKSGFALPAVLGILLVLMILLPGLVTYIQRESKQTIRDSRRTLAFNLAEAAVERGMWKLKSSTSTFNEAKLGIIIPGFNMDTSYGDIPNGLYRIKFSSGPGTREVTVIGEGKDLGSNETRAISAVFQNQNFPSAILTGGIITWANAFTVHWGPVMAQNNINITDASAAQDYFPRKFSRQVVTCVSKGYARDTNGLDPPNTDNVEWWSDYPVPEIPILDFTAIRSSAEATGTLNVFGCSKMASFPAAKKWWGKNACNLGGKNHDNLNHFQNSWNHPLARKQYIWYWDAPSAGGPVFSKGGDVQFTGSTGNEGHGIWGSVIVRGNLINHAGDNYAYTGDVPSRAWEEYKRIEKAVYDTTTKNQYPADDGYQKNRSTFKFGSETWTNGHNPPPAGNTDIGIRGLFYVGGNFDIQGPADVNGVLWVVGNIGKAVGAERTIIFYDENLDLPTLNVVLVRRSWNETTPSSYAWP